MIECSLFSWPGEELDHEVMLSDENELDYACTHLKTQHSHDPDQFVEMMANGKQYVAGHSGYVFRGPFDQK